MCTLLLRPAEPVEPAEPAESAEPSESAEPAVESAETAESTLTLTTCARTIVGRMTLKVYNGKIERG